MIKKVCKECLIEKNNTEFYKHSQGVLGTLPRCKECIKKGRKTERERKMARVNDKKREGSKKRKKYKKECLKKFRKNNPEKHKAKTLVGNFLRNHKEYKQNICFVSGKVSEIIHMHHFDYSKPNEVIPCTPVIHSKFHQGKITEIKEEWILVLPF